MNILKKALNNSIFLALISSALIFSAHAMEEKEEKSEISVQLQEIKSETERLSYLWDKREHVTEDDLQTYISSMENIETQSSSMGLTILILACVKGYIKTVQQLIKKGADVNAHYTEPDITITYSSGPDQFCNRDTPLNASVRNDHIDIIELLMNNGAQRSDYDLMKAIKHKNFKIVQLLLKNDKFLGKYNEKNPSHTFLTLAAKYSAFDIFTILIKYGADITQENSNGYNPLIISAQKNNCDIVEYILENKLIDIDHQCFSGLTALMYAAENGFIDLMQLLLKYGANPNVTMRCRLSGLGWLGLDGQTALSRAAKYNKFEAVTLLLENGALDQGSQAFKQAVENKNYKILSCLQKSLKNTN